jgi:hypothetical protein
MSSNMQHGRRRAESPRKESLAKKVWAATPKPGSPSKRMAAVAIAGALLAGGGIAHAASTPTDANSNFAGVAAAAIATFSSNQPADANIANAGAATIKAPASAKVSFAKVTVASSSANTTNVPEVSGAADTVKPITANNGPINDPTGAQNFASSKLASFGWGQDQMSCLIQLWNRESDWTTTAENPSSLAYGIAQSLPASKMDSVGTDWRTNYKTQIVWGLGYIQDRYGNPCGAWAHETSIGWY